MGLVRLQCAYGHSEEELERERERGSTGVSLKQTNFLSTAKRKGNQRKGAVSVSIPRAC